MCYTNPAVVTGVSIFRQLALNSFHLLYRVSSCLHRNEWTVTKNLQGSVNQRLKPGLVPFKTNDVKKEMDSIDIQKD